MRPVQKKGLTKLARRRSTGILGEEDCSTSTAYRWQNEDITESLTLLVEELSGPGLSDEIISEAIRDYLAVELANWTTTLH
jgi:hypothetical protein